MTAKPKTLADWAMLFVYAGTAAIGQELERQMNQEMGIKPAKRVMHTITKPQKVLDAEYKVQEP